MSAYIVDKNHIMFLVESAMSRQITKNSSFRWFHNQASKTLEYRDFKAASDIANILWRENIKSVSQRYPGESSATLPGPFGFDFTVEQSDFSSTRFDDFNPVQVLKACDCFVYQSCEHSEWETSEAKTFIDALRSRAWHALPGYDKAEWGAGKTIQEKRASYKLNLVK